MTEEQKPVPPPNQPPKSRIIRSWLCEKCSAEFGAEPAYKQHRIDHQLGKVAVDNTPPPLRGVTEAPPASPVTSPNAPQSPITQKPTSIPITLKYIFTGTCPSCNHEIKTIPLVDLPEKGKMTIVAWCSQEDKNIQQRIVVKL